MKWFLNKKNKSEKDDAKVVKYLQKVSKSQRDEIFVLTEEIKKLEKESVHWKEKALNFRRFHQ